MGSVSKSPDLDDSSALQPLARIRLYEELERKLGDYIHEASLQVGDRLPTERDLAERLQVSRASVRQAIVALEVKGVVEVRHGDGMYLRRPQGIGESLLKLLERRQRLPEVLEAREALECKLAELAAKRRTDADIQAIAIALEHMAEEIARGSIGAEGDAEFHGAIAVASHNAVLAHLMDALAEPIHETRIESLSEPGRPPRSLAAHQRIAEAISAKQPRAATLAMQDHLKLVTDVQLLRWTP